MQDSSSEIISIPVFLRTKNGFSTFRNLIFEKILQNKKLKYESNKKNERTIRKALRVFSAEARLTVYRRPRVFSLDYLANENMIFQIFSSIRFGLKRHDFVFDTIAYRGVY